MIKDIANKFTGPMLLEYVLWLLVDAKNKNIKKLYFLARDGLLLFKIAEELCKYHNLDIECKYLYCSRMSLRMPSYHLIGDEMYNLLLLGGYHVTLSTLLKRAELNESEKNEIILECGLSNIDRNQNLDRLDLELISAKIRRSKKFFKYVNFKSKDEYESTVGYFNQEGLFDSDTIAIVDSGWTGSMQRSIRQLVEAAGFKGKIIGYYFGMYAHQKSNDDGEYNTYFFNHDTKLINKIIFSNNVFECVLSAPHGMTTSYSLVNGKFCPNLADNHSANLLSVINEHIVEVVNYVKDKQSDLSLELFNKKESTKKTRNIIYRYMTKPTKKEALFWGQFLFCDDVTEVYKFSLASENNLNQINQYLLPRRLLRYFLRKKKLQLNYHELFWTYGTIAFLPKVKRSWYRINIYVWEWLRYVRG